MSKWAASEMIASEPANQPPTASSTKNTSTKATALLSFLATLAASFLSASAIASLFCRFRSTRPSLVLLVPLLLGEEGDGPLLLSCAAAAPAAP